MASMGPTDELLDPERHKLIMQLLHTIEEPYINSVVWACLWFADLPRIRKLLWQCEEDEDGCNDVNLRLKSEVFNKMIMSWAVRSKNQRSGKDLKESYEDPEEMEIEETPTKKRRHASDSRKAPKIHKVVVKEEAERPSPIASSATVRSVKESTSLSLKKSTGRKEAAKTRCMKRDNNTCVLTGFLEPLEVAHIYAYSIGQKRERDLKDFWRALRMFWTREKVDSWEKQVLGPDGTETCSNMICMANVAHKLWEKACFALKPLSLSDDQRVLTVQFYWLPSNSYSNEMPAIDTPGPFPSDLSASTVNGRLSAKLFNLTSDTKLCSGDILTFETDDPVGHPLPSMELLEMQWVLHRVLALSGAADATDEDLESESDKHFRLILSELDQEDTEEDIEEEMEKEEEGRDTEGEAWEEIAVEAPRAGSSSRNTRTDENISVRRNPPRSRLPRPKHFEHKVGGEQMGQEEQAGEENSPLVLRFRNTNIR